MLYTIIPMEMVFQSETALQPRTCLPISNGYIEGIKREGKLEVTRLISTDPAMFLDERFSPGAIMQI